MPKNSRFSTFLRSGSVQPCLFFKWGQIGPLSWARGLMTAASSAPTGSRKVCSSTSSGDGQKYFSCFCGHGKKCLRIPLRWFQECFQWLELFAILFCQFPSVSPIPSGSAYLSYSTWQCLGSYSVHFGNGWQCIQLPVTLGGVSPMPPKTYKK